MANPVTWFEIIGKDSAGLQKFYREVFNWKLTAPVAAMGNYSMLEDRGSGIGGGIGEGDPRVTVYIEAPDPQAALEKAQRAGARVLMPVTTITPDTTIAMLLDPAGNTFGILKATAPAGRPDSTSRGTRTRQASAAGRPRATTKRTRTSSSARKSTRKTTSRRKRR